MNNTQILEKNTFSVLDVNVSVTDLEHASQTIGSWIQNRVKTYVCIAPVATIVECQYDEKYRQIINNSGMTTPDGMPLVWLGKMNGRNDVQRTYGPDLLKKMCDYGLSKGLCHYFYGATDQTNMLLIDKLKKDYSNLNIAGTYSPPMNDDGTGEDQVIIDQINNLNVDILWVGLGSPKQDYWMAQHRDKLNVPVIIGVGAAFDFIAGTKKQAPRWMRSSGLEWLFRLCCEPKRLWKRYLIGNTTFLYLILKEIVKKKFLQRS